MISYGTRLSDLKLSVIKYITDRAKEGAYRNEPGDLFISKSSGECFMKERGSADIKITYCSVERLCNIADKIYFRPFGDSIKEESKDKVILHPPSCEKEPTTTKTSDMNFEIKSNIPLPGKKLASAAQIVVKKNKNMNYRALPLKNMKVGDCIILHECDAKTISSKYHTARTQINKFVDLMDTKKKFLVDRTDDFKVGVWRTE